MAEIGLVLLLLQRFVSALRLVKWLLLAPFNILILILAVTWVLIFLMRLVVQVVLETVELTVEIILVLMTEPCPIQILCLIPRLMNQSVGLLQTIGSVVVLVDSHGVRHIHTPLTVHSVPRLLLLLLLLLLL